MLVVILMILSCKTRKVDKDYSKKIDQSEIHTQVLKKDSVREQSAKTGEIKVVSKTIKDDSTDTEIMIETSYFNPNNTTPANSKSKSIIRFKSKSITKQISDQQLNKLINDHSNIYKLKNYDSLSKEKRDLKEVKKAKKTNTKSTLYVWIIILAFLIGLYFYFS